MLVVAQINGVHKTNPSAAEVPACSLPREELWVPFARMLRPRSSDSNPAGPARPSTRRTRTLSQPMRPAGTTKLPQGVGIRGQRFAGEERLAADPDTTSLRFLPIVRPEKLRIADPGPR
jgi:hypothetical protein